VWVSYDLVAIAPVVGVLHTGQNTWWAGCRVGLE
jgi:hypothetical protein